MPKPPIHRPRPAQGCWSISSPQTAYLVEYQTYPEDQTETMEEDHLQGNSWAGRMRKFRAGALGVHRKLKRSIVATCKMSFARWRSCFLTNATQEAPRRWSAGPSHMPEKSACKYNLADL